MCRTSSRRWPATAPPTSGRTIDDTELLRPGGYSHDRVRAVLVRSEREDVPAQRVADRMAEERLAAVGRLCERPSW